MSAQNNRTNKRGFSNKNGFFKFKKSLFKLMKLINEINLCRGIFSLIQRKYFLCSR